MKKHVTTLLLSLGLVHLTLAQNLQTGPSTTATPYMWPAVPGATVKSVLTAGDVVGSYTFSGLGDGMGAYDNGGSTFTLLMNHELGNTSGSIRNHGQAGSFISKLVINKTTLQVQSAGDLIQNVNIWTGTTYTTYNAVNTSTLINFNRFCAADLAEVSAFYNSKTGRGTQDRIFMNGEEAGSEGRAFAHIATGIEAGTSYQLPYLGRFSWENAVASPNSSDKTIVMGMDDATPGQVYVYVGNKTYSGTTIEKAGLHGGNLYGIAIMGFANEQSTGFPAPNTPFYMVSLGAGVQNQTGATLNTNSNNAGVTNFLRPEDGAWDPNRPSDFYFNTTNAFTSPSRLWRLRFFDINNPELGGTITAVLDGTEGQKMLDNITFDNHGHILLQEDPGGNNYRAKIYQYKISTDVLTTLMDQDSTRFQTGGTNFLTIDEETSGIIDAQGILGAGWFLFFHQSHYSLPNPVAEGGQLIAYYNPATAAANPEINLQGNNLSIPDGNTVTSTADNTFFGTSNVGTSVSKTFVIQNTNTGSLIVSSLSISGINAGDFVVSGPGTPFTLGPNASQSITVIFTSPLLGLRLAKLNVLNSDFDEKNYDIALSGTGALPEINIQGNGNSILSGSTISNVNDNTDFGAIQFGSSISKTFVIQNTSTGTLIINGINVTGQNSNEFNLINPPAFPMLISANSAQSITVNFTPLMTNTRTAKMWIMNNDSDEPSYSFDIQGSSFVDVGIATQQKAPSTLSIFPNPGQDEVNLSIQLSEDADILLNMYDVSGALVYSLEDQMLSKGTQEIKVNTSSLANGMYLVSVTNGTNVQSIKLMIQH
ncbi:MAG: choice-of-anchor D domain-containing protein [bacterium]|nr:choice-of-anchor D domain-containing protein [bacterium]